MTNSSVFYCFKDNTFITINNIYCDKTFCTKREKCVSARIDVLNSSKTNYLDDLLSYRGKSSMYMQQVLRLI